MCLKTLPGDVDADDDDDVAGLAGATCISTSKQSVTSKVINNIITMSVTRSLQSAARANVRVAAKTNRGCHNELMRFEAILLDSLAPV